MVQPERLDRRLHNHWLPAFTGSRRFRLVGSTGFDGELFGEVSVADDEHVEVALYVEDTQGEKVAAAFVTPDKGLFPSGFVGPGDECAGHAKAKRPAEAVECYADVLKGAKAGLKDLKGTKFRDCPECPELVVVPPGSFMMGSPSGEAGRGSNEGPVHEVRIGYPFAVGVYEVTFGEWEACVSGGGCGGYRPPSDRKWGRRDRLPVVNVNWVDAQAYVEWLSKKTRKAYRLLRESEWEYVARAETRTRYWWGDEIGRNRANCAGCGSRWDGGQTAPVGSFSANGFGLHDVHGNVWEWVEDCYNDSYHGAPSDRSAWESGDCSRRVLRGGSWSSEPRSLRSAFRSLMDSGDRNNKCGRKKYGQNNDLGLRIARTLMP